MIIYLVLSLICSSWALPQGAPKTICLTMMPFHGDGNNGIVPPQIGISPYYVAARRQRGQVLVSVSSTVGVRFQGFLLQGRTPFGDIVGEFNLSSSSSNIAHTIDCSGPRDSVTHNSPSDKGQLDIVWWPPGGYEGTIIFNATIAQDYNTFWLGVQSRPVEISKRAVDDPIPNGALQPITTTPPNYTPAIAKEASTDFDPFYEGCAKAKLCFGSSVNCIESRNCEAVISVTVTGDKYDFELKAESNAAWVGVGLSDDAKMGDDSVIECVRRGTGVAAYMSWTSGPPNYAATRLEHPQLGIQLLNSSIVNGVIYCKVRREAVTNVKNKVFDLINDKYHLLVAAGSAVTETSVRYHDIKFLASGEKQALSDVSPVVAASKLLVRLHGSFMLAAWVGTASVGILLARYYRQTWVGNTVCGKDMWFAWHRMFMVLTWALTMAGFILIFVELRAWSAERNPHAILGTVTTILCFFQPIGAYFRPHPGTSTRPIFNWLHWLVGNAAHIIAIVTLFFAVSLTKAELPIFFDYILAAYVAFHVISHLILSIMGCLSEKTSERRVSSFPMKDLGGSGRSSAYIDRSIDAPFSVFRKCMLALYMLVIVVLTAVLIVITASAPIESVWASLTSSMKR